METKPTPVIDLSKVIARANKAGRKPDMARVEIAARKYAGSPHVPTARAVHMDLPPVDAGRRKPLNPSARHCSGFNHGSFLHSF